MKVRWGEDAIADLDALFLFVAEDSPAAAKREVTRVLDAAGNLAAHPALGRPGRVVGTRELIVPPYIVAYRAKSGAVQILRVLHASRRWPESI